MADDSQHGALQREAMELWGRGALSEASAKFEAAIASCPPTHWAFGNYLGGHASLLEELGRSADARAQLERALAHEIASADEDDSRSVDTARYFLGLHCVRHREFSAALDAVTPSLANGSASGALLRSVEALALAGLGRESEARHAAEAALAAARSEKQREMLRLELASLLELKSRI